MIEGELTLWEALGRVDDVREKQGQRFALRPLLGMAIAAVLAGRDSLAGITRWARGLSCRQLEEFGVGREKAPCHATWHNVFTGLKLSSLEDVFGKLVDCRSGSEDLTHVAIDGKELRGSKRGEYAGLRILSAWCSNAMGVIAQLEVPATTNEISTAMALLKKMPLKGLVITGDAMFCQKKICERIVAGGGDYFFAVKDNQESLKADISAALAPPVSPLREAVAS